MRYSIYAVVLGLAVVLSLPASAARATATFTLDYQVYDLTPEDGIAPLLVNRGVEVAAVTWAGSNGWDGLPSAKEYNPLYGYYGLLSDAYSSAGGASSTCNIYFCDPERSSVVAASHVSGTKLHFTFEAEGFEPGAEAGIYDSPEMPTAVQTRTLYLGPGTGVRIRLHSFLEVSGIHGCSSFGCDSGGATFTIRYVDELAGGGLKSVQSTGVFLTGADVGGPSLKKQDDSHTFTLEHPYAFGDSYTFFVLARVYASTGTVASAVPEPSAWLLTMLGIGLLAAYRRRSAAGTR